MKKVDINLGKDLNPEQYVATWTPHTACENFSAFKDIIVCKLKDVKFSEGRTKNIVLQDAKGAVPVLYKNGNYYDISAIRQAGKNSK